MRAVRRNDTPSRGPSERTRRILSDGAPAPRRADGPVLRQVADAEEGEATVPLGLRARLSLLERLSRRAGPLRVDEPVHGRIDGDGNHSPADGRSPPADGSVLHPPPPARDPVGLELPLEALVGGQERTTDVGTCWQLDLRYDLGQSHGGVALGDALAQPLRLRTNEQGPDGTDTLDLNRAVFLDTETTGLAGGTGTVAFLVGLGWLTDDAFVVRQYFMRDYPEEAGLLQAVREDLGDRPLVSFNGRAYDWPLLLTRWKLARTVWEERNDRACWTPGPRAHVDLLPIARRLWSRTLHSRSLGTIERHILGLARGDDLPGASIPAAYFHYLRTGYSHAIARAFRHNQIDIVSMLALVARVGEIVAAPDACVSHPGDALGTARLLLDLGDTATARRCLEARLPDAARSDAPQIRRLLATLCRRAGDTVAALDHWTALVCDDAVFDRDAHEQVAKLYEHQRKDFDTALLWTQRALDRVAAGTRAHEALSHRKARLERRRLRQQQRRRASAGS